MKICEECKCPIENDSSGHMITHTHRCLVIGQRPSEENNTFSSPTWSRFKKWSGTSDDLFELIFEPINLNSKFNGSIGKGHIFDQRAGVQNARVIWNELQGQSRHIVLLGQQVADCFAPMISAKSSIVPNIETWEDEETGGVLIFHLIPSLTNLFYNEQKHIEDVSNLLGHINTETTNMVLTERIRLKAQRIGTTPEDIVKGMSKRLHIPRSFFPPVEIPTEVPTYDIRTSLADEIGMLLRNWIRYTGLAYGEGRSDGGVLGGILGGVAANPLAIGALTLVALILALILR